jgi:hypothetical protein
LEGTFGAGSFRLSTVGRLPLAALRRTRARWEVRTAVKQARTFCSARPSRVRVCWDLDNTLVDSGTLIHAGTQLASAIVDAEPVPNMLDFYRAMKTKLPDAEHFILSSRLRSMRPDTALWLRRSGVPFDDSILCLVPYVQAKRRVWAQLARDGALVIVDDLSYDHEADTPSIYQELVRFAEETATVYIGLEQIAEIKSNAAAIEEVAARTAESLAR